MGHARCRRRRGLLGSLAGAVDRLGLVLLHLRGRERLLALGRRRERGGHKRLLLVLLRGERARAPICTRGRGAWGGGEPARRAHGRLPHGCAAGAVDEGDDEEEDSGLATMERLRDDLFADDDDGDVQEGTLTSELRYASSYTLPRAIYV